MIPCVAAFMADQLTEINMSHVITEFSFGPHFPGIVQPLDNSFEITHDRTFITLILIARQR